MRKTRNNYVPAEYGGYMFPKCNIPDIHPGDADKVLTVNESATGIEWKAPTGGNVLFIVNQVFNEGMPQMDKTWQEIHDALVAHKLCYFAFSVPNKAYMWPIVSATLSADEYHVTYTNITGVNDFYTDSPGGYPALHSS